MDQNIRLWVKYYILRIKIVSLQGNLMKYTNEYERKDCQQAWISSNGA